MMHLASFGLAVDRLFARSLNVPTRHRPANPRLGVRVWPGLDKPNPYPYPAVPGRVQQPGTIPRGSSDSSDKDSRSSSSSLAVGRLPFLFVLPFLFFLVVSFPLRLGWRTLGGMPLAAV